MPRRLAAYIAGLAAVSAVALAATSLAVPIDPRIRLGLFSDVTVDSLAGVVYWIVVTLVASALPVRMLRGSLVTTSIAPLVVVMNLGGPTAAAWVGLVGTFELRELRGRIPWYGTLVNHCAIVLPAIAGGAVAEALMGEPRGPLLTLLIALAAAAVYFVLNAVLASVTLALRSGQELLRVLMSDASEYFLTFLALGPLAWLVAEVYVMPGVGWWAVLLVVLPVYVIRLAMDRLVAMREMFTQTVASLAQAVDARDHFTSGHSRRVQEIAVEIGNVLRISDAELQVLEWGGLLHDIGKIGVRDAVLLKADRLTKEERAQMNAHPVIGANIIAPVKGLAPELPIIRHHHEWYNGSGYPDRLIGEEIPKLARILHVADAFEAMTAARPYRMTPLTPEQAISELRRFAGVQFDPVMVDAFVRTKYASGARDPGREPPVRVIPTIGQAAGRMATSAGSAAPGSSTLDAS
jgi:HD-GYP domain-containing protein (c-di-GMP phosphodiesterase class II)